MSNKPFLKLHPSEAVITQAAATIYAAYIANGTIDEQSEAEYLAKSAKQAIALAQSIQSAVIADDELG